ncbi:unnamed protein product [Schistosoma rodhaini]|nr:unnamed protein product [Schistosoma rodhaini]
MELHIPTNSLIMDYENDDIKSNFSIIYSHEEKINNQSIIHDDMIDNLQDEMNPELLPNHDNHNHNDHRKESTMINQSSLMWLDDSLDTDIIPLSGLSELSSYSIPILSNDTSENDDSNWSIWLKTCSSQSPATDRKANKFNINLLDEDFSIHHQEPDYAHHRHHSYYHHHHFHHHHCHQYDPCQNHNTDKEMNLTNEESLKKADDTDNHIDDVGQQQQQQQQSRQQSSLNELTNSIGECKKCQSFESKRHMTIDKGTMDDFKNEDNDFMKTIDHLEEMFNLELTDFWHSSHNRVLQWLNNNT